MTFYRLTISEITMICHNKQKQKFTMSSFQVTKTTTIPMSSCQVTKTTNSLSN